MDGLSYHRTFMVKATPEQAFGEFTAGTGGWWPHDHRRGSQPVVGVGFEPHEGGEWYERTSDGNRVRRGEVLVWDPSHRLVCSWPLLFGADVDPKTIGHTELELRLVAHRSGLTRIDLEHRHMERTTNRAVVEEKFFSPYGWDLVVTAFQAYLASMPWLPAPTGERS